MIVSRDKNLESFASSICLAWNRCNFYCKQNHLMTQRFAMHLYYVDKIGAWQLTISDFDNKL